MPKTPLKIGRSTRRLLILVVVLVVLGGLAMLVANPFKPRPIERAGQGEPQKILCDFKADDIKRFEIVQPGGDQFSLVKDGEAWYAEKGGLKYHANQEKIDKLLEGVPGLKGEDIVTDKVEKHAKLEVDDAKAFHLDVFTSGDKPAVQLLVGKPDASYGRSFVRLAGENTVYRSSSNVKSLIGFSFTDYRTKQPWTFEPKAVTKIELTDLEGKRSWAFTRTKEGLWQQEPAGPANQNALTTLVDKLSKLAVSGYADGKTPADTGLEGRKPNIKVTTPAGEVSITLGTEDKSQLFASDQDGLIYQVMSYNLEFYTKKLEFDKLTFDETATEPVNPDEGQDKQLPSDIKEDTGASKKAPPAGGKGK